MCRVYTSIIISLGENIKECQKNNPSERWWIKADACDVRKGLRESVTGKWSGDADLDDAELKNWRAEYQNRKEFARLFGLKDRSDDLLEDLRILAITLEKDLELLKEGEIEAWTKYEKCRNKSSPSDSMLMGLVWDLVGFQDLLKEACELKKTCFELETAESVTEVLKTF